VPLECAQMYQAAIAGARLAIIDRCGHFPQFERPEEFNRVLLDFLSR
jgi:2-hydroxy-6-oxonona-2,4-dienedioate hydrolase